MINNFTYSSDKAIQNYIEELPYELRSIFLSVRDIILINLPFVTEHLKFDVPFYYFNNRKLLYLICYSDRIVLGFCDGENLSDVHNLFSSFNAKGHRQIEFFSIKETYNSKLVHYLQEAISLNSLKQENSLEFETAIK